MANDSKYGRLYPERAVTPLRETAKMLVEDGLVTDAGAFAISDALDKIDELSFPPDEPLFLLRGQDVLASPIVHAYAEDAAAAGAFGIGEGQPEGQAAFEHLIEHAARMEAWEPRKLPD